MNKRWLAVTSVAVFGVALGSALMNQSAASTVAATPSYSRTLYGPDFQSLDIRVRMQFMSNTGGTVYPIFQDDGSHLIPAPYVEAPLDLPLGANITSVRYYYHDCGFTPGDNHVYANGNFYTGYYTPGTAGFAYISPQSHGTLACGLHNFVKTGTPLAVVTAGRRYVVGAYVIGDLDSKTSATPDPPFAISGARVTYTCPTGCH